MNHKRRRPKHQRAGCLWCKPHKDERLAKVPRASVLRRLQDDGERRHSAKSAIDDFPHGH